MNTIHYYYMPSPNPAVQQGQGGRDYIIAKLEEEFNFGSGWTLSSSFKACESLLILH